MTKKKPARKQQPKLGTKGWAKLYALQTKKTRGSLSTKNKK